MSISSTQPIGIPSALFIVIYILFYLQVYLVPYLQVYILSYLQVYIVYISKGIPSALLIDIPNALLVGIPRYLTILHQILLVPYEFIQSRYAASKFTTLAPRLKINLDRQMRNVVSRPLAQTKQREFETELKVFFSR